MPEIPKITSSERQSSQTKKFISIVIALQLLSVIGIWGFKGIGEDNIFNQVEEQERIGLEIYNDLFVQYFLSGFEEHPFDFARGNSVGSQGVSRPPVINYNFPNSRIHRNPDTPIESISEQIAKADSTYTFYTVTGLPYTRTLLESGDKYSFRFPIPDMESSGKGIDAESFPNINYLVLETDAISADRIYGVMDIALPTDFSAEVDEGEVIIVANSSKGIELIEGTINSDNIDLDYSSRSSVSENIQESIAWINPDTEASDIIILGVSINQNAGSGESPILAHALDPNTGITYLYGADEEPLEVLSVNRHFYSGVLVRHEDSLKYIYPDGEMQEVQGINLTREDIVIPGINFLNIFDVFSVLNESSGNYQIYVTHPEINDELQDQLEALKNEDAKVLPPSILVDLYDSIEYNASQISGEAYWIDEFIPQPENKQGDYFYSGISVILGEYYLTTFNPFTNSTFGYAKIPFSPTEFSDDSVEMDIKVFPGSDESGNEPIMATRISVTNNEGEKVNLFVIDNSINPYYDASSEARRQSSGDLSNYLDMSSVLPHGILSDNGRDVFRRYHHWEDHSSFYVEVNNQDESKQLLKVKGLQDGLIGLFSPEDNTLVGVTNSLFDIELDPEKRQEEVNKYLNKLFYSQVPDVYKVNFDEEHEFYKFEIDPNTGKMFVMEANTGNIIKNIQVSVFDSGLGIMILVQGEEEDLENDFNGSNIPRLIIRYIEFNNIPEFISKDSFGIS